MGLAALTRRIPLVLTEADSHLGLANRALAPFARRVCLAFPPAVPTPIPSLRRREQPPVGSRGAGRSPAAAWEGGHRYRVTGRPIPPPHEDRAGARARLGIEPGETCVLVFGGSLGARSINLAAIEAYAGATFHVLHICGRRDHPELAAPAAPAGV